MYSDLQENDGSNDLAPGIHVGSILLKQGHPSALAHSASTSET